MDGLLTIEHGRLEDLLEIGLRNSPPPRRGILARCCRALLHRLQQVNSGEFSSAPQRGCALRPIRRCKTSIFLTKTNNTRVPISLSRK